MGVHLILFIHTLCAAKARQTNTSIHSFTICFEKNVVAYLWKNIFQMKKREPLEKSSVLDSFITAADAGSLKTTHKPTISAKLPVHTQVFTLTDCVVPDNETCRKFIDSSPCPPAGEKLNITSSFDVDFEDCFPLLTLCFHHILDAVFIVRFKDKCGIPLTKTEIFWPPRDTFNGVPCSSQRAKSYQ